MRDLETTGERWRCLSGFFRIRYLAAQLVMTSTIFGTKNSITEPPRFLPNASVYSDLNLRAAIPLKKGVSKLNRNVPFRT